MLGSTSHGRECPGLGSRSGGNLGWWGAFHPHWCQPLRPAYCCCVTCAGRAQPSACRPGCPGLRVPCWPRATVSWDSSYFSAGIRKDPRKSCEDCLYRKDGCLWAEGAFSFTSHNLKVNKGFSLTNKGITLCWGMERGLSFSPGEVKLWETETNQVR